MTRLSVLRRSLMILGLALAMFAFGVLFTRGGPVHPAPAGRGGAPTVSAADSGRGDLSTAIQALQTRLKKVPSDYTSWAALGTAYVQQAAITGDPTYYPKAEGSLKRSLAIRPSRNAVALTGQASLAAARHNFPLARDKALAAQRINPYSAANQGILSDALVQLGSYRKSFVALQRMLDLQPSVPSFTRASYAWELRGRTKAAESALHRALDIAGQPSDKAFCLYYLGELAWNSGHLDQADRFYAQGLREDPSYVASLAGRAKVAAARGRIHRALTLYQQVVQRLPVPAHLIAYADLLRALGRTQAAVRQEAVVRVTERLFQKVGVNVDVELALFDADRGRPAAALRSARTGWTHRRSLEAADAYAWALHVNGRDRAALGYARKAERLGTKSALFAFHRGVIEKSLGMTEAARRSLRDCLDYNAHFSPLLAPHAVSALKDLRR